MLVLTRRCEQVIRIGDDVRIILLSIHKSHVRIGIDAPKEIRVHREEVYLRIGKEQSDSQPSLTS